MSRNPPLYLSCDDPVHAGQYAAAAGLKTGAWRWLKTGDVPPSGAVVRVLGRVFDGRRFKRLSKRTRKRS